MSYTLKAYGKRACILQWEDRNPMDILEELNGFSDAIRKADISQLEEIIPAYDSISLSFKEQLPDLDKLRNDLQALYKSSQKQERKYDLVQIPVCYLGEHAPDIHSVSKMRGLSIEEVIKMHSQTVYRVSMTGFYPGFIYLQGLNRKLITRRKISPKLSVQSGAIGIGGAQTGMYSLATPGGWNIIGRCPVKIISPQGETLLPISRGDYVWFKPVSEEKFIELKASDELGMYQWKKRPFEE